MKNQHRSFKRFQKKTKRGSQGYPEGESCPMCPYWQNRDRFTGDTTWKVVFFGDAENPMILYVQL